MHKMQLRAFQKRSNYLNSNSWRNTIFCNIAEWTENNAAAKYYDWRVVTSMFLRFHTTSTLNHNVMFVDHITLIQISVFLTRAPGLSKYPSVLLAGIRRNLCGSVASGLMVVPPEGVTSTSSTSSPSSASILRHFILKSWAAPFSYRSDTAHVALPYSPMVYAPVMMGLSPHQQLESSNSNVFWLMFVKGNISCCTGCVQRTLHGEDVRSRPLPYNLCLQHKEYIIFENSHTGRHQLSSEHRNVYYHASQRCVLLKFKDFNPRTDVKVSGDIRSQLTAIHLDYIMQEFGLSVCNACD